MSEIAIQVEGLSKQYRIGARQERYRTVRDTIAGVFSRSRTPKRSRKKEILWALKEVSFDVRRGEVIGIIGRNGAGKSTLLKVLSRITEPSAGYARVYGRVGSLLEVGTGFHPELTGRENIYLNGAILGMQQSEISRQFDEIVAFAEVETHVDTPVKHYSSGMYLRLAFAVAAHLDPHILLVDEVLAVGDLSFQKKCLKAMGQVSHSGKTVLFVSHNLAAVQHLCRRCLILEHGRTSFVGPTEEALRIYSSSTSNAKSQCDLSEYRFDTGFEFSSLAVRNSDNALTDTFRSGEDIIVQITVKSVRRISDLVLGVTLYSMTGMPVCNIRSDDSGNALSLPAGVSNVAVRFRLSQFLSNAFAVHLGALGSGRAVLAQIATPVEINIVAGDLSGTGRVRQKGELIYVPAAWQVEA